MIVHRVRTRLLHVDGEAAALGDELVHLDGQVEGVHVREALHVVEVVVAVTPLAAGVRVEPVQVHVVAHLQREEHGEEAAHGLAVVRAVVLLLQQALELHPQLVRAVAEDGVEQDGVLLAVLLEQRLAQVVAREVGRRLEQHQAGVALRGGPPLAHALQDLAHVVGVHHVERRLLAHVRLEPVRGRHVDADHGVVRVDLLPVLLEQRDAAVAHDGARAEAPLGLLQRQQLEQRAREVVDERLVAVLVLQPVPEHGVALGLVEEDELLLVRHQLRGVVRHLEV
eukprot:CAMPEP_0197587526 /NCGR_PEP_ID=MMETSP1326-20131121/9129_1 /TAXON_ID=1155430 /ORGANISM="Genus nov. species nov., Strain RCC2288" /LENGTH=281 /DNA_ID=CAMNT_0043152267 /DNA_START=337 /DNA_END=1178 /DNA_ORIENTATION=-